MGVGRRPDTLRIYKRPFFGYNLPMGPITRKFLIAAMIYFLLGLLLQAVALLDVWLGFNPLAYTSVGATEQTILVGWLSQVALALAYDRWLPQPRRGQVVFVLFNLGLPLTILGQPMLAMFGSNWLGLLITVGGLLQLAGGGFLWGRWLELWGKMRRPGSRTFVLLVCPWHDEIVGDKSEKDFGSFQEYLCQRSYLDYLADLVAKSPSKTSEVC